MKDYKKNIKAFKRKCIMCHSKLSMIGRLSFNKTNDTSVYRCDNKLCNIGAIAIRIIKWKDKRKIERMKSRINP